MTINALAADLVMDRTTFGRNVLPLERDGLIAVEPKLCGRSQPGSRAHRQRRQTAARSARGMGRSAEGLRCSVRGQERRGAARAAEVGRDKRARRDSAYRRVSASPIPFLICTEHARQARRQFVRQQRLFQNLVGAGFASLRSDLAADVAAYEQHRHRPAEAAHFADQRGSGHPRHTLVGDHGIETRGVGAEG